VIDRGQRQAARGGQPFGRGHPDQQGADQPGALGDGDQLDVVERHVGAAQRVVDHVVDQRQVMARGDLGHHAAIAIVDALRGDDVRAHLPRGGDHGSARVVAAGLDGQDHE
jgi:hypothetical protein